MHIEIKNAQITGSIFLAWEYTQTEEGRKTNIKAKADAPIHDDLREAFDKLIPHFVLLTEMKKKPEVVKNIDLDEMDEELLKQFKVRGFSIEEKNSDTYVTLSGMKFLNTGKTVTFDAPKTNRGEGDKAYEFFTELLAAVEHLKDEILEYMEGKSNERPQISMEFEDEADDFTPEVVDELEDEDIYEDAKAPLRKIKEKGFTMTVEG